MGSATLNKKFKIEVDHEERLRLKFNASDVFTVDHLAPFYADAKSLIYNQKIFDIEANILKYCSYELDHLKPWKASFKHDCAEHYFLHQFDYDLTNEQIDAKYSIISSTEVLCGTKICIDLDQFGSLSFQARELNEENSRSPEIVEVNKGSESFTRWYLFDPKPSKGTIQIQTSDHMYLLSISAVNSEFSFHLAKDSQTVELTFWCARRVKNPILTANYFSLSLKPI